MAERTALYRLFDVDGALLYVGISRDVAVRWANHASLKSWWPEVRDKTVTWFGSREEAVTAEKVAIETERPRYNNVHSLAPWRPLGPPRPAPVQAILGEQRALIAEVIAIADPAKRARAISDILGTVKAANAELKSARQDDVLALRGKPMTLREVGELLGMSTGRIDQIAKGK